MTGNGGERDNSEMADTYDDAALAIGWKGPSLVFSLTSGYLRPGQTVLDIGIGTGLGSEPFFRAGLRVIGMDISDSMLEACRKKKIADCLVRHDLTDIPYPFRDGSIDHVISTGVFQFFPELDSVFCEVARVLPECGWFAFITGDRSPDEPAGFIAGPEQTGTGESVTMHCHTFPQVTGWLEKNGFRLKGSVGFSVWMDEQHSTEMPMRAYIAEKYKTGSGNL